MFSCEKCFVLVINFLGADCQLKHITIDLFESLETSRQVLAQKKT
jgi:hypothetical protein